MRITKWTIIRIIITLIVLYYLQLKLAPNNAQVARYEQMLQQNH